MTLSTNSGGRVKYRISRIALLALAATGAWAPAIQAQAGAPLPVVTLEEARRRAATVDPTSVAARNDVGAAAWDQRAAWLDLVTPGITAASGYTRFSEPFFNLGTGGVSPSATSATIEAHYSILGTSKLAATKRANACRASARADGTAGAFR